MPMRPDVFSDVDLADSIVIAAARANGTVNGTAVDRSEYHGRAKAVLKSGAGTGTTPTLDVKVQDSEDNSTWTDVSGATFTQVTTVASVQSIALNLQGVARYIRLVGTTAGAAGGGHVYTAHFELAAGPHRPSPS